MIDIFYRVILTLVSTLSLVAGLAAWSSSVDANVLLYTFNDPTITDGDYDQFGFSVALDNNWVLIGVPGDDTNGFLVGQAHLFNATTGDLLHTFDDPTVTSRDSFGFSVALDGNRVLISAPRDETNGSYVGQVHLFNATTGDLLHTFDDPTVTSRDSFGFSVALDGNRVLIGAPGDDTNGHGVGQAYLFNTTTGALLYTFDDPTVTDGDLFGSSVALDGDRVLIGAPGDDTNGTEVGQTYLFNATSGALLHTFNDPTVTSYDKFGSSVALDGDRVLIGAPDDDTNVGDVGQAHLFDATTGALLQTFNDPTITSQDRFGFSVALDDNSVLIGEPNHITNWPIGQVHLFDAVTGVLLHTFDDPTPTVQDKFGFSVALDGDRVLIGAPWDDINGDYVGQAHLFNVDLDGKLAASILPTSRSVQVGAQATAFTTIINTSVNTAIQCSISPSTNIPANFTYQTTNPITNTPTGNPSVPVNIAPLPELQTFLIIFTPTAAFNPTEVEFNFDCSNSDPAPVTQGVNTLLLSASDTSVSDIIALAATAGETPGIVDIPGATGIGAFAVATVNLGAAGAITVSADTGNVNLPLNISLCETNSATGNCLATPNTSVTAMVAANATPTFSIFATGTGNVSFNPAVNRIFVHFADNTGIVRGSTSVAVRTQ